MTHTLEILEKRPYLDTLAPSVNLSNVGKVGKTFRAPEPPQYVPGTLEPYRSGDVIELSERIEIIGHQNPYGRGYICAIHPAGNVDNLKRGQRSALKRTNLTAYAKRMIVSGGDALQNMVDTGKIKYSVMVTLSYRKNVPEPKQAKKHLANFFRSMKGYGYLKFYAWVAQMQNGSRAITKGLKSYRAQHGDGIHFHILTTRAPVEIMRRIWRKIVATWEKENGYKSEPISGVNVQKVHNASRYISRYITEENKAGTILGNLWGMSAPLRKLSKYEKTNTITITVEEFRQYVQTYRIASKKHTVRQIGHPETLHAVKDWKKYPIVFFRDVQRGMSDIYRFKLHLRTLAKIYQNAQIVSVQGGTIHP